jgi:hypothetical protein
VTLEEELGADPDEVGVAIEPEVKSLVDWKVDWTPTDSEVAELFVVVVVAECEEACEVECIVLDVQDGP